MQGENYKIAILKEDLTGIKSWVQLQPHPRWIPIWLGWWFKARFGKFEFTPNKPEAEIVPDEYVTRLSQRLEKSPARPEGRLQAILVTPDGRLVTRRESATA